jgi:hypothetical protein
MSEPSCLPDGLGADMNLGTKGWHAGVISDEALDLPRVQRV